VLADFAKRHPDIRLRMADAAADDVVAKVRRGDAELGIGPDRPVGDDIARHPLMSVPIRLGCAQSHRLAARKSVQWKDLSGERWVVYSSEFNRELERILHEYGGSQAMYAASEVGYLTTALALVGAGVGVIAVPDYARAFSHNFGLVFLPLRGPSINRKFFVYQRRGQILSQAAMSFVEALRRHARRQGALAPAQR
jgi:DNA-binding transcriptional LysR family regulator